MYNIETRIRYSECGADNKLKIAGLINYFQDCTTENSEQIGAGFSFLQEKKRAWILNSWQIEIKRRPEVGEAVKVSTWATGFQGVFGPRDFCMTALDGEILARAHSLWVYIDTETGRPMKPTEDEIAMYEVGEPIEMNPVSRKIGFPKEAKEVETFVVRKYHIDTNQHVNNSQYIQLAWEIVPKDYEVTGLRVEYKKAAILGDILVAKLVEHDEKIIVGLCDEEGNPYAIVEFTGE